MSKHTILFKSSNDSIVLKELIICLSLASVPVANIVSPVLADPIKIAPNGELQITIKLLTSKQHPQITKADLAAVQKILSDRVTILGLSKPIFQVSNDGKLIVRVNNIKNAIEAENILDILSAVGKLELREQKIGTEDKLQAALKRFQDLKAKQETLAKSSNKAAIATNKQAIAKQSVEINKLFDRPTITNKQIASAAAKQVMSGGGTNILDILSNNQPQPTGMWEVQLEFDRSGGDAFAKMTKNLAGTGRSIGIFFDGEPISTPTVGAQFAATGITGGKAVIMGNFTAASANYLAAQIRSGALPVPIEIVDIQPLRTN